MRKKIYVSSSENRVPSNNKENRKSKHYDRLSLIYLGGCVLGLTLGLFTLFSHDLNDPKNAGAKYSGLALMFTAAAMLSAVTHYIDKSDTETRRALQLTIKRRSRKG